MVVDAAGELSVAVASVPVPAKVDMIPLVEIMRIRPVSEIRISPFVLIRRPSGEFRFADVEEAGPPSPVLLQVVPPTTAETETVPIVGILFKLHEDSDDDTCV